MVTAIIPTTKGTDQGYYQQDANKEQVKRVHSVLLDLSTTDTGATLEFDLKAYGFSKLLGIRGIQHNTAYKALVVEAPTTSVSGSTVTITVGGTILTAKRTYLVFGEDL